MQGEVLILNFSVVNTNGNFGSHIYLPNSNGFQQQLIEFSCNGFDKYFACRAHGNFDFQNFFIVSILFV